MLTSDDYLVRFIRLPAHIKALTCIDDNGFANIYVNDQLTFDERDAAVRHELTHLLHDDAFNNLPIQSAEK